MLGRTLINGPADSPITVVLAHGAGAPMDSPFMETFARGLADAGYRVIRFEFPYMQRRRRTGTRAGPDRQAVLEQAWRDAVSTAGSPENTVIGGKSMGGRVASMLADELGVRGLMCLGYPFYPSGRPHLAAKRVAHLESMGTPTLILQGERDPMGKAEEVRGYDLSDAIHVEWIPQGDHSYVPPKRSGITEDANLATALAYAIEFLRKLL